MCRDQDNAGHMLRVGLFLSHTSEFLVPLASQTRDVVAYARGAKKPRLSAEFNVILNLGIITFIKLRWDHYLIMLIMPSVLPYIFQYSANQLHAASHSCPPSTGWVCRLLYTKLVCEAKRETSCQTKSRSTLAGDQ